VALGLAGEGGCAWLVKQKKVQLLEKQRKADFFILTIISNAQLKGHFREPGSA
jgi:hypothetical protein